MLCLIVDYIVQKRDSVTRLAKKNLEARAEGLKFTEQSSSPGFKSQVGNHEVF
jgi:hypothetical protein